MGSSEEKVALLTKTKMRKLTEYKIWSGDARLEIVSQI